MILNPRQVTEAMLAQLKADVADDHEYLGALQVVQQTLSKATNDIVESTQTDIRTRAATQILAERAAKLGVSMTQLANDLSKGTMTAKALTDNAGAFLNAVAFPEEEKK